VETSSHPPPAYIPLWKLQGNSKVTGSFHSLSSSGTEVDNIHPLTIHPLNPSWSASLPQPWNCTWAASVPSFWPHLLFGLKHRQFHKTHSPFFHKQFNISTASAISFLQMPPCTPTSTRFILEPHTQMSSYLLEICTSLPHRCFKLHLCNMESETSSWKPSSALPTPALRISGCPQKAQCILLSLSVPILPAPVDSTLTLQLLFLSAHFTGCEPSLLSANTGCRPLS
jgi:hypothetical protein